MSDPIVALLEHWCASVCPDARVIEGEDGGDTQLVVPVSDDQVTLYVTEYELNFVTVESGLSNPTDVARIGGILIQLSNVMTQVRTLRGKATS